MTANLIIRMTTTGDRSECELEQLGKGLKVAIFWLQVFWDLEMTKNKKQSITSYIYKKFKDFILFIL